MSQEYPHNPEEFDLCQNSPHPVDFCWNRAADPDMEDLLESKAEWVVELCVMDEQENGIVENWCAFGFETLVDAKAYANWASDHFFTCHDAMAVEIHISPSVKYMTTFAFDPEEVDDEEPPTA